MCILLFLSLPCPDFNIHSKVTYQTQSGMLKYRHYNQKWQFWQYFSWTTLDAILFQLNSKNFERDPVTYYLKPIISMLQQNDDYN